jgi:hypothetical protein
MSMHVMQAFVEKKGKPSMHVLTRYRLLEKFPMPMSQYCFLKCPIFFSFFSFFLVILVRYHKYHLKNDFYLLFIIIFQGGCFKLGNAFQMRLHEIKNSHNFIKTFSKTSCKIRIKNKIKC